MAGCGRTLWLVVDPCQLSNQILPNVVCSNWERDSVRDCAVKRILSRAFAFCQLFETESWPVRRLQRWLAPDTIVGSNRNAGKSRGCSVPELPNIIRFVIVIKVLAKPMLKRNRVS